MQEDTQEASDLKQLAQNPRVSVLMLTYNHEHYLADAIDSVISQQCRFPFELIIGEDASSDATLEIALAYQRHYPSIVRVVYSYNNVGPTANIRRIYEKARGDYLAHCEGDDIWLTRDKLAKQAALMDADPEIGVVHTDWVKARKVQGVWQCDLRRSAHQHVPDYRLEGDLFSSWHFPKILRTCTVMRRRSAMISMHQDGFGARGYKFGDAVFAAYVTSKWKVGYIPEVTAIYRLSSNSALRSGPAARVAFYRSALEFDDDARGYFNNKASYRDDYRWDTDAGLLIWGLRAHDWRAVRDAVVDFVRHFGVLSFLRVGARTVALRIPTLRRQRRLVPPANKRTPPCNNSMRVRIAQ